MLTYPRSPASTHPCASYGANSSNLLAYAPGGGVELVGLAQPVNEMLVQASSADGSVHLFPSWPQEEPARFSTLRVKGAHLVSAAWDEVAHEATAVWTKSRGFLSLRK